MEALIPYDLTNRMKPPTPSVELARATRQGIMIFPGVHGELYDFVQEHVGSWGAFGRPTFDMTVNLGEGVIYLLTFQ